MDINRINFNDPNELLDFKILDKYNIFFISDMYYGYKAKSFSFDKKTNHYLLELESNLNEAKCPHCGEETTFINDRSTRVIYDMIYGRIIRLTVTSHQFKCQKCNKSFMQKNGFIVGKYKYSRIILYAIFYCYALFLSSRAKTRFEGLENILPDLCIPKNELNSIIKDVSIVDNYMAPAKYYFPNMDDYYWKVEELYKVPYQDDDMEEEYDSVATYENFSDNRPNEAEIKFMTKSLKNLEVIKINYPDKFNYFFYELFGDSYLDVKSIVNEAKRKIRKNRV